MTIRVAAAVRPQNQTVQERRERSASLGCDSRDGLAPGCRTSDSDPSPVGTHWRLASGFVSLRCPGSIHGKGAAHRPSDLAVGPGGLLCVLPGSRAYSTVADKRRESLDRCVLQITGERNSENE